MTPEELAQVNQELDVPNSQPQERDDLDNTIDSILNEFQKPHENFNQDISKDIPEDVLKRIAGYLDTKVKEDIKYHEIWINKINLIKPFLGFSLENIFSKRNEQALFNNKFTSDGVYDTTFSTAFLRLWALIRAEILPSSGPVGFRSMIDNDDSDRLGEAIKDALNEYLTNEDKGFYPDFDRFLLYLLLYGCVFRKVFVHPITKKYVSRFILPEDFVVENNCSSLFESNRQTHIRYLSKFEIVANIKNGTFREAQLNYLKDNMVPNSGLNTINEETNASSMSSNDGNNKERPHHYDSYKFYEVYEYLSMGEFILSSGITDAIEYSTEPLPYIITMCATTNRIVSIIPNWDVNDPAKVKMNHFIHYNFFPGFDIYGLGLAQILGTNAVALTEIQRISIDSGLFQIFPGGFRATGLKIQNNNIVVQPGTYAEIDTGGLPLQEAIMPLPYNGPSPVLLELSQNLKQATQELAGTAEVGMSDISSNTPVGTTMAILEVANRMQSAILKTIYNSFSHEIELLFSVFYPNNKSKEFSGFKVIPIADPSVESSTMRIMKAENLLKIAQSAPELHDMRVVYERVYNALGIEDISQILVEQKEAPQQQPVDPAIQAQMADTEQRRLEVESRERIAMMQMEGDGYINQSKLELENAKIEKDLHIANLRSEDAEALNTVKMDLELLKIENQKLESDSKSEIELLKNVNNERIKELENIIEALKLQVEQNLITTKGTQYEQI